MFYLIDLKSMKTLTALMDGKLEVEEWTQKQSIQVAKILTKVRKDIGYTFPCDE